MGDLTITQLFLETVEEKERGIVLGVQTALNQLMDMIKFVMVIVAPQPELFGLLVLISFAFVCLGWILYAKYACSARNKHFPTDEKQRLIAGDGDDEIIREKGEYNVIHVTKEDLAK